MSSEKSPADTASTSEEKQDGAHDSVAITQLESVLAEANRGKKWPAELREKAESLFTEILRHESMEVLVAIGTEIHQSVFESIIQKNWQKLKPEDKEEFVTQLLKLNSEKSALKQIMLADKISRSTKDLDRLLAVELLCGSVRSSSKVSALWPELPKYKAELLQKRFLFSTEGWPNFESDDPQKLEILMAAFIETADDAETIRKSKSKLSLYGFAKWAGQILQEMRESDSNRKLMLQRILALGEALPEWSSRIVRSRDAIRTIQTDDEVNQLAEPNEVVTSDDENIRPVESDGGPTAAMTVESLSPDLGSETAKSSLEATSGSTTEGTLVPSDPSLDESLVQSAPDVIKTIQTSIEWLQATLDLVTHLNDELGTLRQEKGQLEAQLEESQNEITNLGRANARLEQDITRITQRCDEAQDGVRRLNGVVGTLRDQLSKEQLIRAEDGKKFSEQIEREKQFVLNGFKGKLRGSLYPIFENKRTTDHQELSAELAGFFRHWFNEVEEKLKGSGIQLF